MKKIKTFLVLFVFVLVFYSFFKAFFLYLSRKDFYLSLDSKLNKLKKKNIELQTNIKMLQSPFYIEKKVRNDLNLVKEGEVIVLVPKKTEDSDFKFREKTETWRMWVNLILGEF